MKPFNLEAALAGKPVVTRDGRPVKIAGYNPDVNPAEQIAGWCGKECLCWFADGSYGNAGEHSKDLFMKAEKREYWVNVFRTISGDVYSLTYVFEPGVRPPAPKTYNDYFLTSQKVWEEEL